jgi:hypothetical protein
MSETLVLVLVARYPDPRALARRAGEKLFPLLERLEHEGFVTTRRGLYLVTRRGRKELALRLALARTIARVG